MKQLIVNTQKLNFRPTPSRDSDPIGALILGEVVEVLNFSREYYWVNVQRSNGQSGWSSYKYFVGIPDIDLVDADDFLWLKIAFAEINTAELPDPYENYRILHYLRSCELSLDIMNENSDETPWCSGFVNWCMEKSGYEGTDSAWALDWREWGVSTDPVRGSICVFKRFDKSGKLAGGHVGFYLGPDPENENRILVLGGNQGRPGYVKISSYPINNKYYELISYRLP
ncbi:SH3 domain-containing C40 family peptidase [Neolewinella persica]|uniref:SH3 domain-containing C40 family peptidase n=1 Tax=Neolewinella persica TaxID=70998 RepID=UPI0006939331|nr:SH3 domain-containing C40 family peptidase [Neolewinella persica]